MANPTHAAPGMAVPTFAEIRPQETLLPSQKPYIPLACIFRDLGWVT